MESFILRSVWDEREERKLRTHWTYFWKGSWSPPYLRSLFWLPALSVLFMIFRRKKQIAKKLATSFMESFVVRSVWDEKRREETENSLNLFKKDRDRHLICGAFFCANLSVKPSSWGGFFFCYIKHHQKKVKNNSEGEFLSTFLIKCNVCLFELGFWYFGKTKFVRWVPLWLHQTYTTGGN